MTSGVGALIEKNASKICAIIIKTRKCPKLRMNIHLSPALLPLARIYNQNNFQIYFSHHRHVSSPLLHVQDDKEFEKKMWSHHEESNAGIMLWLKLLLKSCFMLYTCTWAESEINWVNQGSECLIEKMSLKIMSWKNVKEINFSLRAGT